MDSDSMRKYRYSPLFLPNIIRLLRLLPREENTKTVRCELFQYQLRDLDQAFHPYEALSYVWGSEDKPNLIIVNDQTLPVRQNLYSLLLRLQDHLCSRVIWVDAICIDQTNEKEKEKQIPLMAEIYAGARRVIVWLGETENASNHALEALRLLGKEPGMLSDVKMFQKPVMQLLQRPWFRRIWILQEVAAARHISIICGSTEIDGHAFCLGLDALGTVSKHVSSQVVFLIRGAIFRSRNMPQTHKKFSLNICSLGELLDIYHTRGATKRHDKVYALLGMCTDDLSGAGLEPDYNISWMELMRRLVCFLLGDKVSVTTWNEKEMAAIQSKGCVLGRVLTEDISNVSGRPQSVKVTIKTSPGCRISGSVRWVLQAPTKIIQHGDLICLLQGTLTPTIVRLCGDHFAIIVIAAVPPRHVQTKDADVEWLEFVRSTDFIRDFYLIWKWEPSNGNTQDQKNFGNDVNSSIRLWNVAQILGDAERLQEAIKYRGKATESLQGMMRKEYLQYLGYHCSQGSLLWAAENGLDAVMNLQLTKDDVNLNFRDYLGRTSLWWVAENGDEAKVKLLLETGKVDVNAKDKKGQTPLSRATRGGHESVVKLLLETGEIDVNSRDKKGRTPLSQATRGGHEPVVKLLLEMGKIDVVSRDERGQTPLSWAAKNGNASIIKLLLETGKVDFNDNERYYGTPLSLAAENGHEAAVKLLLETGKVNSDSNNAIWSLERAVRYDYEGVVKLLLNTGMADVNHEYYDGETPLRVAADHGNEAIVRMLLETGKATVEANPHWGSEWIADDTAEGGIRHWYEYELGFSQYRYSNRFGRKPNAKSSYWGQTPLSIAAAKGHEAVVKLMLEMGRANSMSKNNVGQTSLSLATENGHEAVIKLLLQTDNIDLNSEDNEGRMPLWYAAQNGHDRIIKLLLETSNVRAAEVDWKDKNGQTPLGGAAAGGHESVVKLLLKTGKVDVNLKDERGRTPLSRAAESGQETVAKLLLRMDNIKPDSEDNKGRMPLWYAAESGHDRMVKLLLEASNIHAAEVDWNDKNGQTPLYGAAAGGHESMVKLLLETRKVDVNSRDEYNETPLIRAIIREREAVIKLLLKTGKVDVNIKGTFGCTPLAWAAKTGQVAVVKLLLQTGNVDVNARDEYGETPLLEAAERGHEAVIKLLIETGKIDVNAKNKKGQTPLSQAARGGYESVVKLLLETGKVDVNLKDEDGWTPLSRAVESNFEAVINLL